MKISFHVCFALLMLAAMAPFSANAQTRMQVSAGTTPVYTQPSASAQKAGIVSSGDILFVSRIDGDWVAVSPPEQFDVWLNKDFIEGNRVIAKNIQIRSGPGVQYDAVGTLERGAPVMPRGEDGDWCKIAPPSSAILWVRKSDLSEVRTRTSPIQEVATVAEPPEPAPAPTPVDQAAARPPEPQPAPQVAAPPAPAPEIPAKIAPSNPKAPAPQPGPTPAPAPVSSVPATIVPAAQPQPAPQTSQAVATRLAAPAPQPLHPAAAIPASAQRPATTPTVATTPPPAAPPVRRPPAMPAASKSVPAPASTVTAQKAKDIDVEIDPALVEDLDLVNIPNQGKPIQIEGELRNAPFMAASPSRYRLVDEDEDGLLQMVCHIHGDPNVLRQYVGQGVSIRGREYWVEDSDMPVIVVGQIVPLAPPE